METLVLNAAANCGIVDVRHAKRELHRMVKNALDYGWITPVTPSPAPVLPPQKKKSRCHYREYHREYMKRWRRARTPTGPRPKYISLLGLKQKTPEQARQYHREYMKHYRALGRDTWLKKQSSK